mgnify:FL=1
MEQNLSKKTRIESDLIGSREVPESALYGVQTLRGIENFRISKFHLNEYPLFIQALAITKMGATVANRELDLLTEEQADAILRACKEILEGKHHEQFPVDMIQGGAGTTTNMNANEVIANRALELMGHQRENINSVRLTITSTVRNLPTMLILQPSTLDCIILI